MMLDKLTKYAPPGAKLRVDLTGYLGMLVLQICFAFPFLTRLGYAIDRLYLYSGGKRFIANGAVMADINDLTYGCLIGVWLMPIFSVIMIVVNVRRFTGESMSIYVMKRLPSAGEMVKRCVLLPILFFLGAILLAAVQSGLFLAIYHMKTPGICLPNEVTLDLWRALR